MILLFPFWLLYKIVWGTISGVVRFTIACILFFGLVVPLFVIHGIILLGLMVLCDLLMNFYDAFKLKPTWLVSFYTYLTTENILGRPIISKVFLVVEDTFETFEFWR